MAPGVWTRARGTGWRGHANVHDEMGEHESTALRYTVPVSMKEVRETKDGPVKQADGELSGQAGDRRLSAHCSQCIPCTLKRFSETMQYVCCRTVKLDGAESNTLTFIHQQDSQLNSIR